MQCQFCQRTIVNKGSLAAHETSCAQNPNCVKHKRGEGAGQKKGSVPWNKGTKIGRHKRWEEQFSLQQVLVENSSYPRRCLKRRILADDLIDHKCAICGLEPIWQGKPMPLILDHINGVNNDNRIENLRFVCSNCDTQLPTYKSRNKRKGGRAA